MAAIVPPPDVCAVPPTMPPVPTVPPELSTLNPVAPEFTVSSPQEIVIESPEPKKEKLDDEVLILTPPPPPKKTGAVKKTSPARKPTKASSKAGFSSAAPPLDPHRVVAAPAGPGCPATATVDKEILAQLIAKVNTLQQKVDQFNQEQLHQAETQMAPFSDQASPMVDQPAPDLSHMGAAALPPPTAAKLESDDHNPDSPEPASASSQESAESAPGEEDQPVDLHNGFNYLLHHSDSPALALLHEMWARCTPLHNVTSYNSKTGTWTVDQACMACAAPHRWTLPNDMPFMVEPAFKVLMQTLRDQFKIIHADCANPICAKQGLIGYICSDAAMGMAQEFALARFFLLYKLDFLQQQADALRAQTAHLPSAFFITKRIEFQSFYADHLDWPEHGPAELLAATSYEDTGTALVMINDNIKDKATRFVPEDNFRCKLCGKSNRNKWVLYYNCR